jgi:hypothetical protein
MDGYKIEMRASDVAVIAARKCAKDIIYAKGRFRRDAYDRLYSKMYCKFYWAAVEVLVKGNKKAMLFF